MSACGARGGAEDRPDVGEHAAGVPGWEGPYQRRGAVELDAALAGGLGPGELAGVPFDEGFGFRRDVAQSSIVVCLTPKSEPVAVISTVADGRRLACWCSFRTQRGKLRGRYIHSLVFITEVVKNKQADRRGQIVLFARTVDLSDQFRQRHLLGMRDFFQVSPERIFKADAGLVPINDDGPFNHRGFHRVPTPVPVTVIWQIRNRQE